VNSVVVSFPRTGRTWLLTLIGLNICHYKGIPLEEVVVERKKLVAGTHDHTDKSRKIHADDLSTDKSAYSDKRVVFLTRDPKDTLVSAYLHATKRKHNYKGTLSEYIRDPRYGIEKITRFNHIWFDNQDVPERFMTISYENLLDETSYILRSVCSFFGIPSNAISIESAVRDGSIDKLRSKELTGFFNGGVGKPRNPLDQDSYYHRKGGVGGYVNYMSKEDIEYCDRFQ
jgi:hypothetical protein